MIKEESTGNQVKYSNPITICVTDVSLLQEQQLRIIGDHQGFSDEFHVDDDGNVYANSKYGFVLVEDIEAEFENEKLEL